MKVVAVRAAADTRRLQAITYRQIRSGSPCFDFDQRPVVATVDIGHAVLVKLGDGRFVWRDRALITPAQQD